MKNLPKHVNGAPGNLSSATKPKPCPGCAMGKSHRQPLLPSSSRASAPLELVHADLVEMPHLSIDGYKYCATFLDNYSSLGIMSYLKRKSDTIASWRVFKAWAENQLNSRIKAFRSDRGGEFMSEEFSRELRENGIEREASMPYTPQQNGRAERWQQTIVEKAEAMRHYAGLSEGFWKLAVETAVHIYNRQPIRRANWATPMELWNGKVPDVSYFRVFGCLAYVHVQKEQRKNKLTPRAKPMIFVGYEPGSKGYRFWDKQTRSLVLSRDAVFDESSFLNRQSSPLPVEPVPAPAPTSKPALPLGDDDAANAPAPDADAELPPDHNSRPPTPEPIPAPVHQQPPPQPQPRRSGRARTYNPKPDNVYGDRHPVEIERDNGADDDDLFRCTDFYTLFLLSLY